MEHRVRFSRHRAANSAGVFCSSAERRAPSAERRVQAAVVVVDGEELAEFLGSSNVSKISRSNSSSRNLALKDSMNGFSEGLSGST